MDHSYFAVSYLLLWTIVLLQVYLLLALLRQVGILNLRIVPAGARSVSTGPKVGGKAPEFRVSDVSDSMRVLEVPSAGLLDQMLFFISPGCATCKLLAPGIRALSAERRDVVWAVIAFGQLSECVAYNKAHFDQRVLFCHGSGAVMDLYEVATTPYAVFLRPDGTVLAAGIVNHIEHLESMLSVRDDVTTTAFEAAAPRESAVVTALASPAVGSNSPIPE
jgi:methylamine dehydrogenase accessory protein MauD